MFQLFRLLIILIGIILVVSIVFDRSPWTLLTGLGASAAILTLVFKDTIIGFVSGLQLSSNDMLRVGDWVTVPSQRPMELSKVLHSTPSRLSILTNRYQPFLPRCWSTARLSIGEIWFPRVQTYMPAGIYRFVFSSFLFSR